MGNYHMSIRNETPDPYSYCFRYHPEWEGIVKHGHLGPYERHQHGQREILTTVYVRYGYEGSHSCRYNPMLQRYYNGINSPNFYIRPIGDKIRLCCSNGGDEPWCDNLGERERRRQREERERRRKEEEERRRRERIERERRIQKQISEENDALRNKLGRAAEKRRLNTSLSGREQQHQRSNILAQTVEDDAEGIQYEEKKLVEKRFQGLLKAYNVHVKPSETTELVSDVSDQIRKLFDQLIAHYCAEADLNMWFHDSFDEATQFNSCSLTDQVAIIEALLRVILKGEFANLIKQISEDVTIHEKHALIIRLMATLQDKKQYRALSAHLFGSCLDAFAGLSVVNKDYLELIVFNNLWTPLETIILLIYATDISQEDLTLFLHTARTYRINISEAMIAVKSSDRMDALQDFIDDEEDKPLITVIEEMRQNGVPENILNKVHKVVDKIVAALPSCEGLDISEQIQNGILSLKGIDFNNLNISEFSQILIGLSIAVRENKGYFPRVTQLVSVVTLLLSRSTGLNGCLLQISTGEGKSCIVAMLAVILALRGSTVDIVTSSPLLAMRDVEEWSGYYAKFNLSAKAAFPIGLSKCKTPDQMDAILASNYNADIVYGTVGNFAADTLRQEFEKKTIRGTRGFDAVIVDEVDYMTLDNGVQVTFLSHASSGMRHVEQVLAAIWNMVSGCRPVDELESEEMFWFTNIQHFHKATVSALVGSETNEHFNAWEVLQPGLNLGYLTPTDFKNLQLYEKLIAEGSGTDKTKEHAQNLVDKIMSKIDIPEARDLLTVLEKALDDVAFECYRMKTGKAVLFGPKCTKAGKVRMLLHEKGLASELLSEEEMVGTVKRAIEEKLRYTHEYSLPEKDDKTSDGVLYVPQFLKSYVQNRIEIFIKNAFKAILMTKGREYTIDRSSAKNNTDSPPHHFDCVIPVDFKASGVLEKNKRWGDGLQQFLEMKHQLALTPLSTVTNYLSNFHYFKRYTNGSGVYGVSGTLGDKSDCAFLTRHFKVSCYPIPTHKHKKIVELPMVQVKGGEDAWINEICQKTKSAISSKPWCKGQAALVVCEDMKTAGVLQKALLSVVSGPEKITLYTRSDKHSIEEIDFGPGSVIIATNLGGRGTDISITHEVNQSGGLFVLLTHFPSNRRVEKQIFGRTARKGQPGVAQMVLNFHTLARAYQDQNIDTMRMLREDYERERITNMETDELLTIDIREQLFGLFCKRLTIFTAAYEGLEKEDWGSLVVRDVPILLNALATTDRMDCKPAQNAFKEIWAHWLILNENRIEDNEDVNQLKASLASVLDQRQVELLQGKSTNFYDHTRQALGRMYLHEADHNKDCGTLAAWDRAIQAEGAYRAIAVYNKAYIIINMGKDGYMQEAIDLLKETIKCIDVHVAENANTMAACHIASANARFEPHNQDETNFKRQLEIRNSFFKIWLDYTSKAIEKLQKLKDDGEGAITEEKGIFALIEKPSHLESNELQELFNEGLQVVYEVKKKPRFCIDALICLILGALQVFAGVLVCALSFGSASQIGLGLISEGVSDMIAGVEGMIKGTFDWAEWAISKAISIGMSLLTAGFSKIKDATCAVAKGVKGLLSGAKSLSSVADDCLRAAKSTWASAKTAMTSAAGALSKESLKQSVTTLASSEVARASMKHAAKFAIQEVVSKGVAKGLEVGISKGTQALFEKLLADEFNSAVGRGLRGSSEMNDCLVRLVVCYGVPETTLRSQNPQGYQIPASTKTVIERQIKDMCERVVPELTTDNAVIIEIFSRLKEVKDEMEGILNTMDASGKLFTAAKVATEVGIHTAKFVTMIQNIPTQKVITHNVVPEFKEDIDALLKDGDAPSYTSDTRSNFRCVIDMKENILRTLTQNVASAFTDACASNLNSFLTDFARSKLNSAVSGAIQNSLGRYETHNFFKKQQESYHSKKMEQDVEKTTATQVSERELDEIATRAERIAESGRPPSIVELKAMAASGQLGGKGLEIQTVDIDGTQMSSVSFKGDDSTEGDSIKLRIVREDVQTEGEKGFFTKMKERVLGKDNPWSGRFELVNADGTVTKLDTDADNSLFYAVTKATHQDLSPDELTEKASFLRSEVGDEMLKNPEKYAVLHRRQQEYEAAYGESTFFSLPQNVKKPGLERKDAKVGESEGFERKDATVVDNSFTMTKLTISIKEKSMTVWQKLRSGDKAFLKDSLQGSISLIRNTATPIGEEEESAGEGESENVDKLIPGARKAIKKTLAYIPSKTVLQECSGRMNPVFSKFAILWSQGTFVSMVVPEECEHQILSSAKGNAYGASKKGKTFDVYRQLMTACLCGATADCNPSRLLKFAMICSHPDSTLDILKIAGLIDTKSIESVEDLVKPEGFGEGEIPDPEHDPRVGRTAELDPDKGKRLQGPWGMSDEGLDAYFKVCYLVVLSKYKVADCLEETTYNQLVDWVDQDGFLDAGGPEYVEVLNALKSGQ